MTKKSKGKRVKKGRLKPTHVIIGVMAVALAGVLTYFLWPEPEEEPEPPPVEVAGGRGTVLTPDNLEEFWDRRDNPPPGAHYITTMNNKWTFDTWNTPSENAYVENDIRNEFKVYFDVVLESDGRTVYSSPFIPQGSTLRDFALDESVSAGEHPAIVTYFLTDENDEEVSQLSVRVTLTILG